MIDNFNSLTQYERVGLNHRYNLADGHAHQGQIESHKLITQDLTELWYYAENTTQEEIEALFLSSFFKLAGQHSAERNQQNTFLSYSSSLSIEIIANFIKRHRLTVAVLHPTFDNIPAIIQRVGVDIKPLEEEILASDDFEAKLDRLDTDAIFIVCPNNPTGYIVDQARFSRLVEYCKDRGKLLIIDFCFRFFSPATLWDQHKMLSDAGIDFLMIEDTGKTWPTLDLKVGIVTCNSRIRHDIEQIHNDVLLNVSPFILATITRYLHDSLQQGLVMSTTHIVEENRRVLHAAIEGTLLRPSSPSSLSVEWLEIKDGVMDSRELWTQLQEAGIYVLPGSHFYWHDEEKGNRNIRVALLRPQALFQEAVKILRETLLAIGSPLLQSGQ